MDFVLGIAAFLVWLACIGAATVTVVGVVLAVMLWREGVIQLWPPKRLKPMRRRPTVPVKPRRR